MRLDDSHPRVIVHGGVQPLMVDSVESDTKLDQGRFFKNHRSRHFIP
jgi:hypothetical protein